MITLYTYFRSSAAYRVRIALHLKNLPHDHQGVHLVNNGGEQHHPDYLALNPQGFVPSLMDNGQLFTQSLAICEYLDETYPDPAFLPDTAIARARVRSLAQLIACDIHPVNNLRILKYLKKEFGADQAAIDTWYRHWIEEGFSALELRLASEQETGEFCHGDTPGLVDICLVPQVYNALRFKCDMNEYPTIQRIHTACEKLPAFISAHPDQQADNDL